MRNATLPLTLILALGCAGGEKGVDAGADAGADAGTDTDSDTDTDGECAFALGPEGGSVEACGLRLLAPAGAVAASTTFVVTHPAPTADPPDGLALGAPIFAIAPESGDPEFSFLAYVNVYLPRATGGAGVWAAKQIDGMPFFSVLETCFVDEAWAGFRTATLGTFTVLTDVVGNDDFGSGAGEASWGDQSAAFAFEGIGQAIFQPLASGDRSVDLYGVSDGLQTLRLYFGLPADGGAPAGVTVSIDGWNNWPGLTPLDPATVTVDEPEPGHLVGSAEGELQNAAEETTAFSATFDVQIARHFWGTEDPCDWE